MFSSQTAFFSGIADPSIGGTYLTLLNTFANLGSTWPRYFVLRAVEFFTIKEVKSVLEIDENGVEVERDVENMVRDGYYLTCLVCAVIGVVWLVRMRKILNWLEDIPKEQWKVARLSQKNL